MSNRLYREAEREVDGGLEACAHLIALNCTAIWYKQQAGLSSELG